MSQSASLSDALLRSPPTERESAGERSIFLFVPNLLGYARIVLALVALVFAFSSWRVLCLCYGLSQLLDAADGYVARYCNQATLFGAVLDQVTDRLSTVEILLLDCIVHPQYYVLFTMVLILDLGGHWVHTLASVSAGSDSHKKIPETWPLLKLYYERKALMFFCHAGNEFVWLALFLITQLSPNTLLMTAVRWILIPTAPLCFLKNVTNLAQLIFGAQVLASIDREKRRQLKKAT